jgi:hypothetical protein
MGRTAKRKPGAPSDVDGGVSGEYQQRVTSFFPATKSRPRSAAAAEDPTCCIDSSDQRENIPPGLQCHRAGDQDVRVASGEFESRVSNTQQNKWPQRPLSQLMAERISSAIQLPELPSDKLQQTCTIVRHLKRQASCDIITMYV